MNISSFCVVVTDSLHLTEGRAERNTKNLLRALANPLARRAGEVCADFE
jgi:hypothetical protein